MTKRVRPKKIVDEEHAIRCAGAVGLVREEVWIGVDGLVARYNLAFIHHRLTSEDNGRVLGYDNQHGAHHRHFFGKTESVEFTSYKNVFDLFLREVAEIRNKAGDENETDVRKLRGVCKSRF